MDWFKTWFDSPYYHILYKNRDYREAELFISKLIEYLNPPKQSKILDLACGTGRHSIYLNSLGYDVVGVDLSRNSISVAKKREKDRLYFEVHDMREVYRSASFNYIFSMFTSFGYFSDPYDNIKMLKSVEESLYQKGIFVLDFLNTHKVVKNLVAEEDKIVEDIKFSIKREFKKGFIQKNIRFRADNKDYNFTEKVQGLFKEQIEQLFVEADLKIKAIFGDYNLMEFDKDLSDRLILIAEKK